MRIRTLLIGGAAAVAGAAAAYGLAFRPWRQAWGVAPGDETLALPGDDLVPDASVAETRGIEIDAPPTAVWPWLVQMGFGRAGWYSYDVIDMKGSSADHVNPDLQHLEVGGLVPNSPETAFVVRRLEPGRALVLYFDDAMVKEQTAAARAKKAAGDVVEEAKNLEAATRMMPKMEGFAASWALVLESLDDGRRTRLVERFRVKMPAADGPAAAIMGEAFGVGVFAMTRKQMLGIRDRVEASARSV